MPLESEIGEWIDIQIGGADIPIKKVRVFRFYNPEDALILLSRLPDMTWLREPKVRSAVAKKIREGG